MGQKPGFFKKPGFQYLTNMRDARNPILELL